MDQKKKRKKKAKLGRILVFLFLVGIAIYGGMKLGEYMAVRSQKPIEGNNNALSGIKGDGKTGTNSILTEDEMVNVTSIINEFLNAEHRKRNERLAVLTDENYYNTLLKEIKNLTSGDVSLQDINYTKITETTVKAKVTYTKVSKKYSEDITLNKDNKTWKIVKVERAA
jgi:hypothetical protein